MPQNDWQDHLTWAQHHATSLQQPQHCDPTILWAIAMQRTIPQLPQLQHNVLLDIADLRDDLTTDTLAWFEQLPPHCQRAYRQPKMITQVPLMTHLLHLLNYPQAQLLHEELSLGFDLLGPLRPGVNWHIRHDHKYLDPCDLDELRSFNKAYIQRKLQLLDSYGHRNRGGSGPGTYGRPLRGTDSLDLSHSTPAPLPPHQPAPSYPTSRSHCGSRIQHTTDRIGRKTQSPQRRRLAPQRPQPDVLYARSTLPSHTRPLHPMCETISRRLTPATCVGTRPRRRLPSTAPRTTGGSIRATHHTRRPNSLAPPRTPVRLRCQRLGLQPLRRCTHSTRPCTNTHTCPTLR